MRQILAEMAKYHEKMDLGGIYLPQTGENLLQFRILYRQRKRLGERGFITRTITVIFEQPKLSHDSKMTILFECLINL